MARLDRWTAATRNRLAGPTRPVSTKEERRRHLWGVIVSVLVCVELFFDGSPESPDAGSWGETRRPLLMVGVGVLALLVTGAVQAKWGRRESRGSSSAGSRGLGEYPAWFALAASGLGIVGLGLFVYAAYWSLRESGSLHVLERRMAVVLLIGSGAFASLMSWLSSRGTSRGQGDS